MSKQSKRNSNNNSNGKKPVNHAGQNRGKGQGFKPRREQPRKDSDSERVNYDNTRVNKFERDIERGSKQEDRNDIADFNRNPELLTAAASIPFASILGERLPGVGLTVPGVMSILYNPTFGTEKAPLAWNKAYQQIYSYIVHANSRAYAQDFTDYALIIQAGIEVFTALADAVRAYGVMKSYNEPNNYLVEGLLRAMGWDANDLRRNLSDMWFSINDFIIQTRDIWVPNVMPIIQRQINLNSFVYTDAPGERSQSYVYVRDHYYMLSETGSSKGTALVPAVYNRNANASTGNPYYDEFYRCILATGSGTGTGWANGFQDNIMTHTWAEFKSMLQLMIDRLMNSQDRGIMYGNIMNAYGSEKLFALSPISADYTVKPTFNAEVLMQIENITTCESCYPKVFAQDGDMIDGILTGPQLITQWFTGNAADDAPSRGMPDQQIINMHITGRPTPEAVIEATRMKVGAMAWKQGYMDTSTLNSTNGQWTVTTSAVSNSKIWLPSSAASELPRAVYVTQWTNAAIGASIQNVWKTYYIPQYTTADIGIGTSGAKPTSDLLLRWMLLMPFDWHPFLYSALTHANASELEFAFSFNFAWGDYDNYTFVNNYVIDKMNTTCMYSLMGIPQSGYNHKVLEK